MKTRELRAKSTEQLEENMEDLAQKRRELNFKLASGQLKNVREVRKVRKDIARISTLLKEIKLKKQSGKVKEAPVKPEIKKD